MLRRWRGLVARRGVFQRVIPATVVAPPANPTPRLSSTRRRFGAKTSEGRFFTLPIAATAAVVPAVPPKVQRSRLRWFGLARRGEFYAVPLVSAVAPAFRMSDRRVVQVVRHGQIFRVPVAAVVPPQAVFPPGFTTRRRIGIPSRRSEFQVVVAPPVVAPAVVFPPEFTKRRRPAATSRRGQFQVLPSRLGQVPVLNSRRRVVAIARRGQFQFVPVAAPVVTPAAVVPGFTRRRRLGATSRPGDFQAVLPAQAVVQVTQAPRVISRRRLGAVSRSGKFFSGVASVTSIPIRSRAQVRWLLRSPRGRFAQVPPPPVVIPPAAFVPSFTRADSKNLVLRRGRFHTIRLVGLAPAAPAYVPDFRKAQPRRLVSYPRGDFWSTPKLGVVVTPTFVPGFTRADTRAVTVRRGRFLTTPPAAAPVIAFGKSQPRRLTISRHGKFQDTVRTVSTLKPVIEFGKRRRGYSVTTRHGQFLFVPTTPTIPIRLPRRLGRSIIGSRSGKYLRLPLVGITLTQAIRMPTVTLMGGLSPVSIAGSLATADITSSASGVNIAGGTGGATIVADMGLAEVGE